MTVPPDAITAADGTLLAFLEPWLDAEYAGSSLRSQIRTAAALALRDAAPLIAADVLAKVEQGIADGAAEVITQAVTAERQRIRPLIARWRQAAQQIASSDPAWSSHYYDSATELERLLDGAP